MKELLRDDSAFSLTELMVVIVIIGILALLALPRFMSITTKAKMTEAKTMLKHFHTLQQGYHYERDRYASSLSELGFEQALLISGGGTARYEISVEESNSIGYVALATSIVDFDKDGTLNVWMVDETGAISERVSD